MLSVSYLHTTSFLSGLEGVARGAMERTVNDQLRSTAEHQGVDHVWRFSAPTAALTAFQCAYAITAEWLGSRGPRVLWRPCVAPSSSAEAVQIRFEGEEVGIAPASVTIDCRCATLDIEGERITIEHRRDRDRARAASKEIGERLEQHIRETRIGRDERRWAQVIKQMRGPTREPGQ